MKNRYVLVVLALLLIGAAGVLIGGNAPQVRGAAPTTAAPTPTTYPDAEAAAARLWPGHLQRHAEFVARAKEGPIGVMLLGDSITAGWSGSNAKPAWKKYFEPLNTANFGIGSDTLPGVQYRITHGELDGNAPKVVMLLIGTNNIGQTPESVADGIKKIVTTIREKQPATKVLVMGVFPRGKTTDPPKFMENVKAVNSQIAKLDNGKMVRFIDLGDKLATGGKINADCFADGVHLTEKGYLIWGEGVAATLKAMIE